MRNGCLSLLQVLWETKPRSHAMISLFINPGHSSGLWIIRDFRVELFKITLNFYFKKIIPKLESLVRYSRWYFLRLLQMEEPPFAYFVLNQTKPNQTKPNQTKPNQTKPNKKYLRSVDRRLRPNLTGFGNPGYDLTVASGGDGSVEQLKPLIWVVSTTKIYVPDMPLIPALGR